MFYFIFSEFQDTKSKLRDKNLQFWNKKYFCPSELDFMTAITSEIWEKKIYLFIHFSGFHKDQPSKQKHILITF